MSTISSTTIDTLGTVLVNAEYTDASVNGFWQANVNQIFNVFNSTRGPNNTLIPLVAGGTPQTDPSVLIWEAVQNLKAAAANGIDSATGLPVSPGTPPTGKVYYLTQQMANSLDQLIRSLEAAHFDTQGFTSLFTPQGINALNQWVDLGNVGLSTILLNMENGVALNRSLQSLLELDYVRTGNDVIGANLQSLHDALTLTNQAMQYLTDVQNLKNQLTPTTSRRGASSFESIYVLNPDWTVNSTSDVPKFIRFADRTINGNHGDNLGTFLALKHDDTVFGILNGNPNDTSQFVFQAQEGQIALYWSNGSVVTHQQLAMTILGHASQIQSAYNSHQLNHSNNSAHSDGDGGGFVTAFNALGYPETPYDTVYKKWMEAVFEKPIAVNDTTQMDPSNQNPPYTQIATDLAKFEQLQSNLTTIYTQLNTQFAGKPANEKPELMTRIKQVLDDMNQGGPDPNQKLFVWIQDNYANTDVTTSGGFQTHLTQCITAAQSLNDTQKQNLQNYIYVFQQFYTSAASMLATITAMITKMADNIKG